MALVSVLIFFSVAATKAISVRKRFIRLTLSGYCLSVREIRGGSCREACLCSVSFVSNQGTHSQGHTANDGGMPLAPSSCRLVLS